MPVLTAKGLRKSFGPQVILDDVEIHIRRGERIGLVGNNGSGKSSLGRILAQRDMPDAGQVAVRRDASVVYLEQEPALDPERTAHEVCLEGLGAWNDARERHARASRLLEAGEGDLDALLIEQSEAAHDVEHLGGWELGQRADRMLTALGLSDVERKVGTLSGGERRRVALARCLLSSPDLAILDEPTNHLDAETIEWLERYLSEEHQGALLLITHDRYVLDSVVQRTLELDQGKLYGYAGGWSDYLEAKAERQLQEAKGEANRQNLLRRELEWLRRQPKARGGKQKARVDRAEAARDQAAPTQEKRAELKLETTRLGSRIIEVEDLVLELGGRRLVDGLTLKLTRGTKLGVIGRNGAGKTSLLRVLLGELRPTSGKVLIGDNTRIAYFDQARSGLRDEQNVLENVADGNDWVDWNGNRISVYSYLDRLLFPKDRQRTPVGSMSGGERARVALAKLMLGSANVLVMDEPTNDLDVATLSALEELLIELNGVAIVVTHDRYFLDRIATDILAFERDDSDSERNVVHHYVGNYSTYRRLSEERRAELQAQKAAADEPEPAPDVSAPSDVGPPPQEPTRPPLKKLTYAESKELEGIEDRIAEAEAEQSRLEAELADPDIYRARAAEVPALQEALASAQALTEQLMARWEELETRRAATQKR
ncbi:MAG: ABC-F family ATP-binding cassette domain-containing protein [Polyangiaceae bacterium]